ncbi:MAG: hypothetical protein HYS17_11700 [Micavibrio aeruginosavorus]|uniref:Uncharacterized protein n=1 Tax=Micavibrio aeruginosavorus TaxID=349221 RepID=A0A7T5R282_9BACT|nr:MAG: hypothetical protein HYS17_11700 [Micavibrio aeruginosavorus]
MESDFTGVKRPSPALHSYIRLNQESGALGAGSGLAYNRRRASWVTRHIAAAAARNGKEE